MMKPESRETQALLRQVSRSFYLTLHVLPGSVRGPLSLAYLLARATDTVADTEVVAADRRRELLQELRENIREACQGRETVVSSNIAEATKDADGAGADAERRLLERLPDILDALSRIADGDRLRIQRLLETITEGQENDLVLFGKASTERIASFEKEEELDRYTYQVAGCVGEFWTEMCRAHVFPEAKLDEERLMADAVRFGKGLQLVNILRDLPQDLQLGRCYIPREQLERQGLTSRDLLDASAMTRFRPLYGEYVRKAEEHLSAGWRYTTSLPFRCVRVRLACAWPVLIGVQTLSLLRKSNVLDPAARVKVSRSDLRRIILRSLLLYPKPRAWTRMFQLHRNRPTGVI